MQQSSVTPKNQGRLLHALTPPRSTPAFGTVSFLHPTSFLMISILVNTSNNACMTIPYMMKMIP